LAALLCAGMLVSCTGEKKSSTEDKETVIEEKEEKRTEEGSDDAETKNSENAEDESDSKKEEVKATEKVEEITEPEEVTEPETAVGDTITLGTYEQDGDLSNGTENIEWIVLKIKDGKALVTSQYALDCQPYNTERTNVTWENCTLRQWLNNDFYDTAFSESEKTLIQTTTLTNNDNIKYSIDGGNDTSDKVFVLSSNEINLFKTEEARKCQPTKYCDTDEVYTYQGNCRWWVRTPGFSAEAAAYVADYGAIANGGSYVEFIGITVRPAMWITLD